MTMTPAMQISYDALKGMDKQLKDADAHLAILQRIDHPAALKLASDLQKAKDSRAALMKAIEHVSNS